MNKKITRKKIFLRFLKENNCYRQYVKNYYNNFSIGSTFKYTALDDLYENSYNDLIEGNEIFDAFSWDSSNEGFDFWYDIDDKWQDIYDEYRKNKYK